MKKTLFFICLLMPLSMQSMEPELPKVSNEWVDQYFQDFETKISELEALDSELLALIESRMNGSLTAIQEEDAIYLHFSTTDSKKKPYICTLPAANQKISRAFENFNNSLIKEGCANNWSYYERVIKEKLAKNPKIIISEDALRVQMGRFIEFMNNDDLNIYLQKEEELLQYKADESFDIQTSKKITLQKKRDQINQIKFNRIALQLALAANDAHSINEARKKELNIPPYVSFRKYMRNSSKIQK